MAYIVETPNLRLIPLADRHFTATYVGWLNDPSLMQYSQNGQMQHDLESCRAYAAQFDHKTSCLWALETTVGEHIGNLNAHMTLAHGLGDIGILIGAKSNGKGWGLEAWKAAIQVLFLGYNLRKVTGGCLAAHHAMKTIMKRAGMVPDGIRFAQFVHKGRPCNIEHMSTFGETFEPNDAIKIHWT